MNQKEYRAEGVDGIVTANEIEISIKFKGLGRITHGGDESYPIERVKAVGFKEPGFARGHIQFGVLDANGRAEANSTNSGFIFGSNEHQVLFDKKSLKEFMSKMEERLAILVPDPKKLEQFAALKKAYEHYKLMEKLCQEPPKEEV